MAEALLHRWLGPAVLLLTACGDPATGTGGGSTSARSSTSDDASGTADSSTSTSTGTSAGSESTGDCDFICDSPPGPVAFECSVFDDTCPAGTKCNYYANDGSSRWNAAKCFPVVGRAAQVDDECVMFGEGASGLDSCVRGAMCWGVDSGLGVGVCVPFCTGTMSNPVCDDPWRTCSVSSDGVVRVCDSACDPLDADACGDDRACYAFGDRFRCQLDASGAGGEPLSPCEANNACNPGSTCATAAQVGTCPTDAANCCTPLCDLYFPDCPAAMVCTSFYEDGATPPGAESIGLCGAASD